MANESLETGERYEIQSYFPTNRRSFHIHYDDFVIALCGRTAHECAGVDGIWYLRFDFPRFYKRILNLPYVRICVSNYNKFCEFFFFSGLRFVALYDINFFFMLFVEFMADTIVEF